MIKGYFNKWYKLDDKVKPVEFKLVLAGRGITLSITKKEIIFDNLYDDEQRMNINWLGDDRFLINGKEDFAGYLKDGKVIIVNETKNLSFPFIPQKL